MKKKEYYNSKIKHQLNTKLRENKRKESVFWSLTKEQIEFVTSLGYEVKPYLYKIETKKLKNVKTLKENILKEIHYNKSNGRKDYFRTLSDSEKDILVKYNIKYDVVKYQISLKR